MADNSGTIEFQDNTVIGDFWPTFNVDSPYFDVEECAQGISSMAVFTLQQYGIPYRPSSNAGGPLASIDIKRMDAMAVINQSLMEEFPSGGYLVEPIVDEEGFIEFVQIGSTGGGVSDVYYTVQSHQYQDTVKGVMITGGRPLPLKRGVEWKPIWGEGINNSSKIYSYVDMLGNCNKKGFDRYATITFNDPYLDQSAYNDGRVNLFEIDSPWDRFLGYMYYTKIPPDLVKDNNEYTMNLSKTATVPVQIGVFDDAGAPVSPGPALLSSLANLGNIQILQQFDPAYENCWSDINQGTAVSWTDGVEVKIRGQENFNLTYESFRGTTVDKFVRISGVYVIGVKIDYLKSAPASDLDAERHRQGQQFENRRWVSISDSGKKAFKLAEGKNYAVTFDEPGAGNLKTPYIVFAQESKPKDPAKYGTNVEFFIDPACSYALSNPDAISESPFAGSILPLEQNRGILVEQIWVTMDLETPSIVINDPKGDAKRIAEALTYYIGPLKIRQEPAPLGYAGLSATNGTLVDQESSFQDSHPTTAQDPEASEVEQYYDEMQGGGMALTLSFLDEIGVVNLAAKLYSKLQFDGVSTVHTCGPCAKPKLGRYGQSGVINSIQYSYSDKGAYTISVQEGPYILGGLTPVDGGPTQKMAEEVPATGTIIKDVGNNVHFKVLIDGYGERWAISTIPAIMRVGDIVCVTVHNNPVEA